MCTKRKHGLRDEKKPEWRDMAQSIPPNLYVKTLNLKSKTKNKSNIQDNKRKK
jgi:hypothetical protein